eukprot:403372734
MSYHTDHMAWQQRVSSEMNAHRRYFDRILSSNAGSIPSTMYESVNNYMQIDPSYRPSTGGSQMRRSQQSGFPSSSKNKQSYTFGGKTSVNQKFLHQQDPNQHLNQLLNNPVLGGAHQHHQQNNPQQMYQSILHQQNQHQNQDFDAISQASGAAYVGRSKLNRAKSAAGSQRSQVGSAFNKNKQQQQNNSGMKVYIPKEYYQHAGYMAKDQRSQISTTKSQMAANEQKQSINDFKKERFNEQLNYNSKANKKDEALSAYSKGPQSTIGAQSVKQAPHNQDKFETQSRAQSSYFKKRILDRINMMDEQDLEKIGHDLNIEDRDDKASVITQDKLKKFNEIYGFEGGPAVEDQQEDEEEVSNPNEGDEQRDEVHSLGQNQNLKSKALLKSKLQKSHRNEDGQSIVSGATRSVYSKRTVMSANGSIKTSKTYISALERQLNDEKRAREKLEKEIEEIKKINTEISSKLGISTSNAKQ